MAQRTFIIERTREGKIMAWVHSSGPDSALPHVNLHSPDGFECGYPGSGPADLAASILARHYLVAPERVVKAYRERLPEGTVSDIIKLHQDFKREFIEPLQLEPGTHSQIADDTITAWLQKRKVN